MESVRSTIKTCALCMYIQLIELFTCTCTFSEKYIPPHLYTMAFSSGEIRNLVSCMKSLLHFSCTQMCSTNRYTEDACITKLPFCKVVVALFSFTTSSNLFNI